MTVTMRTQLESPTGPSPRGWFRPVVAVAAAGGVFAAVAVGVVPFHYVLPLIGLVLAFGAPPETTPTVTVPGVVNLPVETAEARIRAAGLVPERMDVASPKEVGTVVDQNPGDGEKAPKGSQVQLSVSKGPDTVDIPDLKGYAQDEARAALANLDLKVASQTKSVDDSGVDKGKVVETSPGAGTTVSAGSEVVLTLSSGKVTVPDVVGRTRNDASDALSEKGLNIKTVFKESTEPENTVIAQSIKDGTKVDDGTTITITVAQAPTPTPTTTTTTPTTPPTTTTTTPTLPTSPTPPPTP